MPTLGASIAQLVEHALRKRTVVRSVLTRGRYSVSLTPLVLIGEELQVLGKFSTFDFCLCQVDFLQRLAVRREVQLEQNGHTVI